MTRYGEHYELTQEVMDNIARYMDDDIRELLHCKLAPCKPETFLKVYLKRDPDFAELLKEEFSIELGEPEQVATITIDELIELLKQSSVERGAVTGSYNGSYAVLKDHYHRYKESGGVSMEDFDFIRGMIYGLYATDFVTAEQLDTMISDLIAMK